MTGEEIGAIVAPIAVLLAAIGGGWITLAAGKRADDRADVREANRARDADLLRQSELAGQVADLFQEEIQRLRAHDPYADIPLDSSFVEYWWERGELDALRLIDRLTDDELRGRLHLVLECLLDTEVRDLHWKNFEDWLIEMFSLGRALAMAAVRGQRPDPQTAKQYDVLDGYHEQVEQERARERVEAWNATASSTDDPGPQT